MICVYGLSFEHNDMWIGHDDTGCLSVIMVQQSVASDRMMWQEVGAMQPRA